jgi:hypothetical protein
MGDLGSIWDSRRRPIEILVRTYDSILSERDMGIVKITFNTGPGTHPFNHILFANDMTLLTQDTEGM